jgi:hypothetical protein
MYLFWMRVRVFVSLALLVAAACGVSEDADIALRRGPRNTRPSDGGSSSSGAPADDAAASSSSSGSTSSGGVALDGGIDGGDAGKDATAPVDCSTVTLAGVPRQTVAAVRTSANLSDVDVTRYAGIWEAHNAATGQSRQSGWGFAGGFVIGVLRNAYIALAFETGPDQAQGGSMFREVDAQFGVSHAYWSISKCPGDFVGADACHSKGAGSSLGWRIGNSIPNYCHLEPNTTYYLNIRYGTAEDPTAPSCESYRCGHVYQQLPNP